MIAQLIGFSKDRLQHTFSTTNDEKYKQRFDNIMVALNKDCKKMNCSHEQTKNNEYDDDDVANSIDDHSTQISLKYTFTESFNNECEEEIASTLIFNKSRTIFNNEVTDNSKQNDLQPKSTNNIITKLYYKIDKVIDRYSFGLSLSAQFSFQSQTIPLAQIKLEQSHSGQWLIQLSGNGGFTASMRKNLPQLRERLISNGKAIEKITLTDTDDRPIEITGNAVL